MWKCIHSQTGPVASLIYHIFPNNYLHTLFCAPRQWEYIHRGGGKNRAKASPWGAVLRLYAWGLATQRGLFTLNTPQGYSADRWASFLSLITSLKRWLTLRTHKRQHSFILEFFCCCCLRRRAGGKRLETVHLKGKHFYFFGEWILWPGVSFSSSSSSSSSEPVFNARCSKRRGCLCENASVQGGTICKIKECLWAVQGQKQK